MDRNGTISRDFKSLKLVCEMIKLDWDKKKKLCFAMPKHDRIEKL